MSTLTPKQRVWIASFHLKRILHQRNWNLIRSSSLIAMRRITITLQKWTSSSKSLDQEVSSPGKPPNSRRRPTFYSAGESFTSLWTSSPHRNAPHIQRLRHRSRPGVLLHRWWSRWTHVCKSAFHLSSFSRWQVVYGAESIFDTQFGYPSKRRDWQTQENDVWDDWGVLEILYWGGLYCGCYNCESAVFCTCTLCGET